MKKQQLKFAVDEESFFLHLRKEVYGYFRSNGISIYADNRMLFKTIFFFLLFFVTYGLIIFSNVSVLIKLGLCFLHGIAITGIGFNVSHDCGHNAYFKKKKYKNNKKLQGKHCQVAGKSTLQLRERNIISMNSPRRQLGIIPMTQPTFPMLIPQKSV